MKTIYLNLEDDVTKVAQKIHRESADEVVLVFPKQSFVFSDSINMRLLKKQVDMLGKRAYILTMDEKGQMYSQEAGFELKYLPRTARAGSISDIRRSIPFVPAQPPASIDNQNLYNEPTPVFSQPVPAPSTPPPVRRVRKVIKRVATPASPVKKAASAAPVVAPRITGAASIAADNVYVPPTKEPLRVRARRSYRSYIIGFIALAMILALLLVLVVLPSATINVYAKSQLVSRDIDIIADVNAQKIDPAKLTIPAVAVNENRNVTATFQTLGKKELGSKAQGRVSIYNLTGQPITLKASTTTLTVGSKTYAFAVDQTNVKAVASVTNDAGAPVADIVAIEGGEGSNLPAGTRMEITNQAFGSQPQRLFAKTETQVIGGSSRFVSVVSADDIKKAQEELVKKMVQEMNDKLKAQNRKIAEGGYTVNVTGFSTDKPEGTESPSFSAQAQISITGLAFNETELKQMIRQRLLLSLGMGKALQEEGKDTVSYKTKNIDAVNGVMQLSLHYESAAIPTIDEKQLKNEIAGKSKAEASELILSDPNIEKTEISVQPAWQSSLPRFTSKIRLELKQ